MRKPFSNAEIPNKSATPYALVKGCGKRQAICGKTSTHLWKQCGMRGENLAKR